MTDDTEETYTCVYHCERIGAGHDIRKTCIKPVRDKSGKIVDYRCGIDEWDYKSRTGRNKCSVLYNARRLLQLERELERLKEHTGIVDR